MRRFSGVLAVIAIVAAACSSTPASPATPDPYELARKAMATPRQQVQINVGASVKASGTTVSLDPANIQIVVDSTAGKGLVHISLPVAALGADSASLQALGITGSTLDVDAIYDGQALYAKSPLIKALVQMLAAGGGSMPSGDLGGWLRLATSDQLKALGSGVESAAPSPSGSLDAASVRKDLGDAGLTLTFAGTETRNGAQQDHVTAAVDVNKLLTSPAFDSVSQGQAKQIRDAAANASVSGGFWVDHGSGQLSEIDIHFASTGRDAASGDVTITLAAPAAGTSFAAPAGAVDLPIESMLGEALKMFGGSLSGQ